MKTKQLVGSVIVALGIGALCYLFVGYIKPRLDFDNENKAA